jgi:predicted nuclease with RNAse H fold
VAARARQGLTVAGIDVGGPRKGFHAVALVDGALDGVFTSTDPALVAAWCAARGARHVGVDAPSGWSPDGRMRPAERALLAAGIPCFASPTRAAALAHPKNWYGWMLNGERLYGLLARHYRLYAGAAPASVGQCFETFPQAIACALAGRHVPARDKRARRRALLEDAGIDTRLLTNIDLVDAALCALAAQCFATARFSAYGDAADGFIVIPAPAAQAER